MLYGKSQKKAAKSNLGKFLKKCNFSFFNAKNWPIFADFAPFFPSHSILLTFWIELMLPNDGQILVDDFRLLDFSGLSYGHFSKKYLQNHCFAL